jgi:hypothetical protein
MVRLPGQPIFGVEGGTYVSARVEGRAMSKDGKIGGGGTVLFNDPELLALYPFATNVSSWSFNVQGNF